MLSIQLSKIEETNFQIIDLNYFNSRDIFYYNGSQNVLKFPQISNTFRLLTRDTETIIAWESKRLSDESIELPTTPGNSLASRLKWIHNPKIALEGADKTAFTDRNMVNLFIFRELDT